VTRYRQQTGGEIAVMDPSGHLLSASSADSAADAAQNRRRLLQSALAGQPVSVLTTDQGRPWTYAAVPINAEGVRQGAVLLGVSAEATQQHIQDVWYALAALGAGVLLVTATVGALLARSISRPLSQLELAVRRFGDGDLAARASPGVGPPQVRSLAEQFNRMAATLGELVDAQNRFVADASHQLRSPLTALRLRLENLEAGADSTSADALAAAGREVLRLSRIVDGLLALSIAAQPPVPGQVDVAQVLADRCDAWAALAAERRVDLVPELPDDRHPTAPLVAGDLEQILDNLLANALDVSPEGGEIRVRLIVDGAGSAFVHVVDRGPGMSVEERERAFDRFWQGSASGGHSGLGLAIVSQLARRNHARVELRPAAPSGIDAIVQLTDTTEGRPRSVPVPPD
jgi:signal transduction histidine kinase